MRQMMAAAGLLVVMSCAKAPETPPHDPAADKAAVDAVRNREQAALNAGNIDSLVAVYADDIDMMAPGAPTARGTAAVRDLTTTMLAGGTPSVNYTSSTVEISGDIAIDRYTGTFTMTPKAGGLAINETIKGLHVLRRQADGSWRIIQDVWNADPPATPPVPPAKK